MSEKLEITDSRRPPELTMTKDGIDFHLVAKEDVEGVEVQKNTYVVPSADVFGKQHSRADIERMTGKRYEGDRPAGVTAERQDLQLPGVETMDIPSPDAAEPRPEVIQDLFPDHQANQENTAKKEKPEPKKRKPRGKKKVEPVEEDCENTNQEPEVEEPLVPIFYSMESGSLRTRVHKVIANERMVVTMYDLKYEKGTVFYPREDRAELTIETTLGGMPRTFKVISLGLRIVDPETSMEYTVYLRDTQGQEADS